MGMKGLVFFELSEGDDMNSSEFAVGDPRRVLAAAKASNGGPLTELLWGCQDPDESLCMSRAVVEGGWLIITLSEYGSNSFTSLGRVPIGTRVAYFVHRFSIGSITQAPMFLGYLMADFEADPNYALRFPQGGSNRIYFRKGLDEKDERVEQYSFLTEDEIDDTARRLDALAIANPAFAVEIEMLREALARQDSRIT